MERSIKEVLQDIVANGEFHLLDEIHNKVASKEDRTLLANLYAIYAEELIKKESIEGAKEAFNKALDLAPSDATLWQKKALVLAHHNAFDETEICFKTATSLSPSSFDSWYAWGSFLLKSAKQDFDLINNAEGKFLQAEDLIKTIDIQSEKKADFYWQWGLLYSLMFRHSGEAVDAHKAVSHFRKASSAGVFKKEHYSDFVSMLIELGLLLNQESYLFEAIALSCHLLQDRTDKSNEERSLIYFNLAISHHALFRLRLDQTSFLLANECFEQAFALNSSNNRIKSEWGSILLMGSKLCKESCYLESSIKKLSEVLTYDDPVLISNLAEAKAIYGADEEDFDSLKEANLIIQKGKLQHTNSEELFNAASIVAMKYGSYFADKCYYDDAISHAKEGLSQYPNSGKLAYTLALAKSYFGEDQDDKASIQEALVFYEQAAKTELGKLWYFWNDWGVALFDLAERTHDKKYLRLAEEKFEQAILRHEMIDCELLLNYGCTLDFLGDLLDDWVYYERAIQVFSSAIALDPTETYIRFHLACSYVHLGDEIGEVDPFLKADFHFQQVSNDDPEDEVVWNEWGVALLHHAELISDSALYNEEIDHLQKRAEHYFLQALALGDLNGYYNLACLYSIQNNVPDAVHYLEKAREAGVLPAREALLDDDWLENVRKTAHFGKFLG